MICRALKFCGREKFSAELSDGIGLSGFVYFAAALGIYTLLHCMLESYNLEQWSGS